MCVRTDAAAADGLQRATAGKGAFHRKDSVDYTHLAVITHCTRILQGGFRVGDCKRVRLSAFDYEADDDDNLSIQVLPSLVACQMHPKVYARCLTGRGVFGYEFLRRREMFLW